jgi:DNA/RNA endonuclease G (NUC1)
VARTNIFMVDSDLETYLSQFSLHAPTPEDYHGSCFDRGHQCPSADRDSTVENNQATFFMSNMIPQTAYLNRIIWAHLEQYTRDLVEGQGKKVFVVAGPIFDEDFGKIGLNNDIPIPSKNFKIIYIMDKDLPMANINSTNVQTITTIMPNILRSGKKPLEDKVELCSNRNLQPITSNVSTVNDWEQFKSTPEEVERLSGIKLPNIK